MAIEQNIEQLPLRDIMAYWGCPIQYNMRMLGTEQRTGNEEWMLQERVLNNEEVVADLTEHSWRIKDVKLGLRQAEDLIPEENKKVKEILKGSGGCEMLDDGEFLSGDIGCWLSPVIEATRYLQSIGVYVPGTIDEKYIELI